jgi:hypothetical protein
VGGGENGGEGRELRGRRVKRGAGEREEAGRGGGRAAAREEWGKKNGGKRKGVRAS